ncbi:MAG: Lipid A export ATP-binding/permease protein MsbA [Chlamydiia bacterium]|nr:Lipid A export ATP-binding/permease protein MsbA [Chlamydiia bacterium]
MKIFFKILSKVKHHYVLFIFSLLALLGLTVFNQLEIVVFGAIAKTGSPIASIQNDKLTLIISWIKNLLFLESNSFSSMIAVFVFVGLSKAVSLFFNKYLTNILAVRICRDLRNQCYAHMQKLPLSFFSKYDRGKLSTRVITDVNQMSLSFNSFVTNYIHLPFIVLSTLSLCFILSWKLTLILGVAMPLVAVPLKLITMKIRRISFDMQKKQESFASIIIDHLSGIFTIKSYQLEKYSMGKYAEENLRMTSFDEKIQKYDKMSRPITHFMMTVILICIMYIGIHVLGLSFPDLIVYCMVIHMLYPPFKQFSDENASVQKGIVAANRLFDILNEEPEKSTGKLEVFELKNSLIFNNLFFSYGTELVLEDLSFDIQKGEVLAITGATGSGKSTLLKLFSRLYDISSGEIFFDGVNIKNVSLSSLRDQFGLVAQESFFFNDTVRSNLIFDADIDEVTMIEACKTACIHDFILTLDDGYDTVIEEMGKNLSGGQKQRLSIARALIRKASILLLDEATSSLDAVSEKLISESLQKMKGEMTQVIVAHRLSTIQHADKVLYLEHGKIKAFGTLAEVLDKAPGFAAMWDASQLEAAEMV